MKIKFNLNANNGAVVAIEYAMQKTNGLVVVGKVANGNVSVGDTISIQVNGKDSIADKIVRIECFGNEVLTASINEEIGIQLERTSKETLSQYLS